MVSKKSGHLYEKRLILKIIKVRVRREQGRSLSRAGSQEPRRGRGR